MLMLAAYHSSTWVVSRPKVFVILSSNLKSTNFYLFCPCRYLDGDQPNHHHRDPPLNHPWSASTITMQQVVDSTNSTASAQAQTLSPRSYDTTIKSSFFTKSLHFAFLCEVAIMFHNVQNVLHLTLIPSNNKKCVATTSSANQIVYAQARKHNEFSKIVRQKCHLSTVKIFFDIFWSFVKNKQKWTSTLSLSLLHSIALVVIYCVNPHPKSTLPCPLL